MRLPLLVRMRRASVPILRVLVSWCQPLSCPQLSPNESTHAIFPISKWPHGCCYSVMAMFSAFGSLYMNFTVIMSCFFLQITELNPVTGELIMSTRTGYGMLARQVEYGENPDYQQCIYYPDDEKHVLEDSFMKGSTMSAYACAFLQVIACVVLSTTCCCAYNRACWERWMMWTYIYASCFMACTFLMYGTHFCRENDCDMAHGGGFAISSWMFLVCCANVVKNMGQPPPDDMVDPDDDEDNLWYDDDADRFPQHEEDDYDEYDGEESFGGEDYYDDAYDNRGIEMQDSEFLDPNKQGGMVPYNPDDAPSNGGMVAHANPDNPYAQYAQPPAEGSMVPHDPYPQPPPADGGMEPYVHPSDPSSDPHGQNRQVGGFDGPELL